MNLDVLNLCIQMYPNPNQTIYSIELACVSYVILKIILVNKNIMTSKK